MADAADKLPFYVFKGECEERAKIVLFLVENNALEQKCKMPMRRALLDILFKMGNS